MGDPIRGKAMKKHRRRRFWLIVLLVVIALTLGGFIYWQEQQSRQRLEKKASVTATAEFDATRCSGTSPIMVTITNPSDDTVTLFRFGLNGYRSGHSKPVYSSGYRAYQTDRIIETGKSWSQCWQVPNLAYDAPKTYVGLYPPESVIWRVSDTDPTFKRQ